MSTKVRTYYEQRSRQQQIDFVRKKAAQLGLQVTLAQSYLHRQWSFWGGGPCDPSQKMMLEELERRNDSQITNTRISARWRSGPLLQASAGSARTRSLREYQAYLFRERKLAPNTVIQRTAALRFFFVATLETLGDCRNPVPTQDLPTSKDSQSGRSSTAHQCGFLGVFSRPKRIVYDLLFWLSAETLLQIAHDPEHLGAEIGFFSVLHSWNQKLEHHPHIHCVVQAGGLSPDHTRWITSQKNFFLPVMALGKMFRGKFREALKEAFLNGQLSFHGSLQPLARPKVFAQFLRQAFRKKWVSIASEPFGGPAHALRLLRLLHPPSCYLESPAHRIH